MSRIRKDPSNFKERIKQKLEEFGTLQQQVISSPGQKSLEFESLCVFFGQIFEYYPSELKEIITNLRLVFLTLREQLHQSARLKIISTILLVLRKGFIDPIESLDLFLEIFGFEDKALRSLVFSNLSQIVKTLMDSHKFQ